MQTITIDITNNKSIRLLQNLEVLQLIRMHKDKTHSTDSTNWVSKYKVAITKQTTTDINNQLNKLRNGWE